MFKYLLLYIFLFSFNAHGMDLSDKNGRDVNYGDICVVHDTPYKVIKPIAFYDRKQALLKEIEPATKQYKSISFVTAKRSDLECESVKAHD